ncbi:MAG: hypothetical protein Q4A74_00115 [Cardiobacteriaceae bacterium]|nr:hypothetical protein [Cardiobacteriaceae bacterium]
MITESMVEAIELTGLRVDCKLNGMDIYNAIGVLCGQVYPASPEKIWFNGEMIRRLYQGPGAGSLFEIIETSAYGSNGYKMPDLFILHTDKGLVKIGNSLGFTSSDPTLFTGKQLNVAKLRVSSLYPTAYKVN